MSSKKRGPGPSGGGDARPEENDNVARLVPDPGDMPDLVALRGWLGRSTSDRLWRIYQDLELSCWIEVSEDDVVHTLQEELWTIVWVRRGAALRRVETRLSDPEAEYLSGGITEAAAPTERDAPGSMAQYALATKCFRCSTYTPCG